MFSPLVVDAHEDIAWNVLTFGRNYTHSAAETRSLEAASSTPQFNGDTLLGWPDYQRGRVAVVFGSLFAAPARKRHADWETQCYADADQAHQLYRAQMSAYRDLVEKHGDKFHLLRRAADLEVLLGLWDSAQQDHPVGLLILMEGAEAVRKPDELSDWWDWGVRVISPAWAGTRFCGGTGEPGPLTAEGEVLLGGMAEHGFILDLSHMDETAARQALDLYQGPVIATHANAAALLPGYSGNRHLGDELIVALAGRSGIIGVVPFCRFLSAGWKIEDGRNHITMEVYANHVDHICQLTGCSDHAGIGSDFDGGFGLDSVPAEIDTVADLLGLQHILFRRGYNEKDVSNILGGNWLRLLKNHL